MNPRDHFTDLLRHMEWADASTWSAVLGSETASADRVVLERLHHIHLVQRAFLSIWNDQPIDVQAGEGLEAAELARWAEGTYELARSHVATVGDEAFDTPVKVPWTEQVAERLGFEPAATTLTDTLVQVTSHSTHHRAQVMTRLRELDVEPPLVDYIAWVWRRRPPASWG